MKTPGMVFLSAAVLAAGNGRAAAETMVASTRVSRPLSVSAAFGGPFLPAPGIQVAYQLTDGIGLDATITSMGWWVDGSLAAWWGEASLAARWFVLSTERTGLHVDVGPVLIWARHFPRTPILGAWLGYEVRGRGGFTAGARAGVTIHRDLALPSVRLTVGKSW
jgi:hypothetical protein